MLDNIKNIKILEKKIKDKTLKTVVKKPLDNLTFDFLNNFSNELKKLKKVYEYPDLVYLMFWCKRNKIEKLKDNNSASMLFYDKEEKIQVRAKIECTINHKNEITKKSWLKTGHMSRKCYLVDNGPGTESVTPTSGLKPELDNFEFTMEQSEEGYKNFTVIQCKIKNLEWLYLSAKGHRRARLEFTDYTKGYWLIP